jgi:polyhydroxybutyrate depolymerase
MHMQPVVVLSLLSCAASYTECGRGLEDCFEVPSGRYLAVEPDDGAGPMEAAVYFHGYSTNAEAQLSRSWMDDLTGRGWLVILPDGYGETWSHENSPSSYRDEIAFIDEVLADVRQRWDVAGLYGTGFSQGASMAWYTACERGGEFEAFFPASGSFWEPLPESCPGAPVNMRHTHGTSDTVFPLEGRAIGDTHQGDTYEGLALWRAWGGCPEAPDREEVQGEVTCQIWETCTSGKELRLCLHDGGHTSPADWMVQNLDWAASL